MCGIVGFIAPDAKDFQKRKDYFTQALYADALRGQHSTGIFSVKSNSDVSMHKKAMSGYDFLDLRAVEKIINSDGRFMIGHNRFATIGSQTNKNAHPFYRGDVIGVHNGTLNYSWRSFLPAANSFDVDSEALFNAFAVEDYKDILSEVEGAFALSWYDQRDKTLKITRNEERPLFIASLKDKDYFFIASEAGMLNWLANRTGHEIKEFFLPKPGEVYKFPLNDPKEFEVETIHLKAKKNLPAIKGKSNNGYVNPYVALNLNPTEELVFDCSFFEKYNANNPRGMVLGYVRSRKDKDGHRIKFTMHGIDLNDLLKEAGAKSINEICFLGRTSGVTNLNADRDGSQTLILNKSQCRMYKKADASFTEDEDISFGEEETSEICVKGPDGKFINLTEFNKHVKNGCIICGDPIDADDANHILWTHDNQPICKSNECQETALFKYSLDLKD